MNALIDTNILSELVKPQPNAEVSAWVSQQTNFYLSVISLEELHYGLRWKPNARVQAWLERFIRQHCQLLDVSEVVARYAGTLRGALQQQGETRSQADMLIAATAHTHDLTLVTRNEKDFTGCGVTVFNPFS